MAIEQGDASTPAPDVVTQSRPARWLVALAGLWCWVAAGLIWLDLSVCGMGTLFGGIDTCPPAEVEIVPPLMVVGGIAILLLAAAGGKWIAIAGIASTAVGAMLAGLAATLVVADRLIEAADPYGYASGPRLELVGYVLVGLLPASIVGLYGVGFVQSGSSNTPKRRLASGGIAVAALAGAILTVLGFSIAGPPPNPRTHVEAHPGYQVVLPRGFETGGSYTYGFVFASAGQFSLPADVEWFDREPRYDVQLSVEVEANDVDSLDAFDAIQARNDARAFGEPVATESIEVDGRPAIKRTYITEASPRRTEQTSVCVIFAGCEETTISAWTDRRFFLDYEGPAVRVQRVITVAQQRGWVLSVYEAAPHGLDAAQLFDVFVATFKPMEP